MEFWLPCSEETEPAVVNAAVHFFPILEPALHNVQWTSTLVQLQTDEQRGLGQENAASHCLDRPQHAMCTNTGEKESFFSCMNIHTRLRHGICLRWSKLQLSVMYNWLRLTCAHAVWEVQQDFRWKSALQSWRTLQDWHQLCAHANAAVTMNIDQSKDQNVAFPWVSGVKSTHLDLWSCWQMQWWMGEWKFFDVDCLWLVLDFWMFVFATSQSQGEYFTKP